MLNSIQIEECIAYMRARKGFHRLLEGFKEKYIGLGYVGGSVRLSPIRQVEIEDLEGFLGRSLKGQKSVTISASKLQEALNNSRFHQVTLKDLLMEYYGNSLETKKDVLANRQKNYQTFFEALLQEYHGTFSGAWLKEAYENRGMEYQYILLQYKSAPAEAYKLLGEAMTAGNALPAFMNNRERLAVFAATMTGDPHYFDEGNAGNRILTYIIQFYYTSGILQAKIPTGRKEYYNNELKNELFFYAGLMKDDLSNYTMVYGIDAYKKNREKHQGIHGYYTEKQPVIIALLTLGELVSIESKVKTVFILENPAVFAAIAGEHPKDAVLVCTNGQPRLSSLILLDLFYKQEYQMFYAGDFDPEGLQIADKLKSRYSNRLILWRYGIADYENAKSQVLLSEQRLKKLQNIKARDLSNIRICLEREKHAGYQERLIEYYLKDIRKSI